MIGSNSNIETGSSLSDSLKSLFSFPNPVNEVAARSVAAQVVVLSSVILITGQWWLSFVLAYGFLARVATGPTLSPMGLLATRVIAPKIGKGAKLVAGPPKRFAQTIGLIFSTGAVVLYFVVGSTIAASAALGVLTLFAFLEAAFGFCAGCMVFGYLMKWGVIPESVCQNCTINVSAADAVAQQ